MPEAHNHRTGAGHLKRPSQSEDTLADSYFADACFATGQHGPLEAVQVHRGDFFRSEHAVFGALELGTLGGAFSWATDINAVGEVVGSSTSPQTGNTGFFWSASVGMYQLPVKGQFAVANAVSDVRPDGTRLVVGMNSQSVPVVWVVRNP